MDSNALGAPTQANPETVELALAALHQVRGATFRALFFQHYQRWGIALLNQLLHDLEQVSLMVNREQANLLIATTRRLARFMPPSYRVSCFLRLPNVMKAGRRHTWPSGIFAAPSTKHGRLGMMRAQ